MDTSARPVPLQNRGDVNTEKPPPLDLSHHYSVVTKRRRPSNMKAAYKFFEIPGILNIAGGLPNVAHFPFDTLEAQTAKPVRWTPSPNYPGEPDASAAAASDPAAATHIAVPKTVNETDPLKKIDLATALQYGLAKGYPPLLSWVRQFTREHLHPDVPYRDGPDVVLTCGSTDGFAKTLNLFVNQWTEGVNSISERPGLLCDTFAYPNAINQALPYGVQIVPVKADAAGMAVEGPGGLEDVLANWDPSKGKRPHLMYTVTLGHNPTGIVLSVERKKEIYAVCSRYDVIIVEDEPYWYLQFPSAAVEEAKSRGLPPPAPSPPHKPARSSGFPFLDSLTPSFLSIDTEGRVVRLDTFSKTVAPGCRLGWITAAPAIVERLERITEATTQQPSGFVQSLISELVLGSSPQSQSARAAFSLLRSPREQAAFKGWDMSGWVRWIEGLRGTYERRMARMCRILDAGSRLVTSSPLSSSPSSTAATDRPASESESESEPESEWSPQTYQPQYHPTIRLRLPPPVLDGPTLAAALMVFLTEKPYRVLAAAGGMFAATDAARRDARGWAYFRLCFAAEAEANIDRAAERFVRGVHAFWEVRDVREIERLLGELQAQGGEGGASGREGEEGKMMERSG
ncbi:9d477292-7c3a-4d42-a2f0-d007f2380576 [Thermothielavioides terrestris]|uniref:9d477292-7c3a-4d42-a2f0-d007f2380576 n=1 Tax=Thermothielavioides terrestris TaxID=2587410 RepID=A0A446BEX5_9PEZI|nr:9d477292-7c3a-4d42-a2f0-d007f2380576 [Thermothielavioides terrestris]